MRITFYFTMFLMCPLLSFGQVDSTKLANLSKEIETLKMTNETLLNSLEITGKTLNDLVRDKKVSDETKWNTIKRNINGSAQLYKVLSDDIINLKSRLADEEYQGYIKSLSSIQEGPLGFSFQEVIIESATKIGIFDKQSKLDRFIDIAKNVMNSPLIASIPFVSNAVTASNSILDIAYGSSMNDRKADLEKLKKFESQLNKYLAYYTTLDKANILNQSSNGDRRVLLENLQIDLLNKLKKDAPRLNLTVPNRKENETMDAYFNRILTSFNHEFSSKHLVELEQKYKNDRGEINYSELLQKEIGAKYYNNNIDQLVELSKKYTLYYENFFEVADNYQFRIIEAVNVARSNGIIEGKKEKGKELNPAQVYDEIIKNLNNKKTERDNGIRNSINIPELKQKMELLEEFKLI
ncbi:hypothetical protein BXY82_2472 [Gelidibacter sediminis]|uniref:Uncharacterized protein n=1 Tax=Gelidibacter sediminis TaxID=1608710 RepID=A0A4R7PZF2_9FLAO|nr:hypothetical protein [Gelidibacter sediminis]TDU40424.1 hypothetical protein BXY82_2472 [Gelidibacter sediminis]